MRVTRQRLVLIAAVVSLVAACQADDSELAPPLTLPPGVTVGQDFERLPTGLAVDMEAANERFNRCLEDAGLDPSQSVEGLLATGTTPSESRVRSITKLCGYLAGVAWGPGQRADEVEALNAQARATTQCVRDRGWVIGDPLPEEYGRFLRFNAESITEHLPTDSPERQRFNQDLTACVDDHAVKWDTWVQQHPRN